MAACARSETLSAGLPRLSGWLRMPRRPCILAWPEEISRLRFPVSPFLVRRRFLLGPQSEFWFPCCCQRLTLGDLVRCHLLFRRTESLFVKLQIVLGSQPQPHL